jgi:hypothetical protein
MRYLLVLSLVVTSGCGPMLRNQDVTKLKHVQSDIAVRHSVAEDRADREALRQSYCDIETVLEDSGEASGPHPEVACNSSRTR